MHAMNILSVTEAGNRQAAGCLAGSTRPGGSSLLGVGERQVRLMVKQRNRAPEPSSPLCPFPGSLAFPSPQNNHNQREQEVMERGGSSRRGNSSGLAPMREAKVGRGRRRREEGEKTHTAWSGRVSCLGVCGCLYVCNGVCTFPIYRTSSLTRS